LSVIQGEKNLIQNEERINVIIKQVMILEKWIPALSTLPEEKRQFIYEKSGKLKALEEFVKNGSSLRLVLINWTATNIEKHKQSIDALYTAVIQLNNKGILDDSIFSPDMIEKLSKEDIGTVPKNKIVMDIKKRSLPGRALKSFFHKSKLSKSSSYLTKKLEKFKISLSEKDNKELQENENKIKDVLDSKK